jgi:ATP-dependent Clp protease ATP-binding subunit ClpA
MPRHKQALQNSRRIADGLGAPAADTEHLLAGIVAVRDSMAVEILRRLNVSADDIRGAPRRLLAGTR